jgi:hypothetical protein
VIYAEVSAQGNGSEVATGADPGRDKRVAAGPVGDTALILHAEQWELARTGETILSIPVLKKVVGAWLADREKIIEIQYPGGEDGDFWVQELTDWLVSLGIPSDNMFTTPGSGADDVIKFKIIKKIK